MIKRFIPKKYHYKLSNLKNALRGGYARTHYSQFGEDITLAALLPDKAGVYVDVGAHHPKRYSNTYLLFKKGWHGINIDPNPHTIGLFNKARPNDINIECGVAGKEGTLTYYQFSDPAVNSFSEEEAKRWMNKSWLQYLGTKEVEVQPLRQLLNNLPNPPTHIDLLNIDTEGMDVEVLQSNDWQKYQPRVIVIESGCFDASKPFEDPAFRLLVTTYGYTLAARMGASLIFSRA